MDQTDFHSVNSWKVRQAFCCSVGALSLSSLEKLWYWKDMILERITDIR